MVEADLPVPTVELIAEGSGEKSVLRWDDEGADQSVDINVTRGFSQVLTLPDGTVESDSALADTTMTLPLQANVTGGGDNRAVTAELDTPSGSNSSLEGDIATAKGFRAAWSAGDDGAVEDVALGAPETASNTARVGVETSMIQWLTTPVIFPTEAVGEGARWTVDNTVDDGGVAQTITYTLVNRDGDIVELDATVDQSPTEATAELDDEETGVTLSVIDSGTTTSEGSVTVDLSQPIPVDGSINFINTIVYGDTDPEARSPRITQRVLRTVEFGATD